MEKKTKILARLIVDPKENYFLILQTTDGISCKVLDIAAYDAVNIAEKFEMEIFKREI